MVFNRIRSKGLLLPLLLILTVALALTFSGCDHNAPSIAEDGSYTSPDEVALYLDTFGKLPQNFITKSAAKDLGWVSSQGNLDEVAPGKSIGGDRFGNYEGLLPKKEGRSYYECDVNYNGGYRGEERIVWSSDGLIYYTDDHYESFTLLYGDEDSE